MAQFLFVTKQSKHKNVYHHKAEANNQPLFWHLYVEYV